MNKFLDAVNFRYACKTFNPNKKIEEHYFDEILEVARLSPSSMGVEPTRLVVVQDEKLRIKLKEACWGQDQLTSASHVVVLKSVFYRLNPHSNYIYEISYRRGKSAEEREIWIKKYGSFLADRECHGENLVNWANKQAYLMASSMMNYAAYLGIDSCPIEGYDIDKINSVLDIDELGENVALILTFGYRVNTQSKRYRVDKNDFIEYK